MATASHLSILREVAHYELNSRTYTISFTNNQSAIYGGPIQLVDYNTKIPHHSLSLRSPIQYLIHQQPEVPNVMDLHRLLILMVFAATLIVSACGTQIPSASDAEQEIREQISRESEGRINLLGFQKTDGQEREVLGRKMYVLEFSAKIKYIEACRADFGYFGTFNSFKTQKIPKKENCRGADFDCLNRKIDQNMFSLKGKVKKNQIINIHGSSTYEKKESGWKLIHQEMKRTG